MDITSIIFLIFLFAAVSVYLILPHKMQWGWLLLVSLTFYFLNSAPYTIVYLLVSILSVYGCTRLWQGKDQKTKKLYLILTIVLNVAILAVLKYTTLGISVLSIILSRLHVNVALPTVSWVASLGISFYTLQIIAYLLDCYWERVEPQTNVFKLALFTSYFPQMISGPINRYKEIGEQLFEEHRFDYERIVNGIVRITWGIFQKRVISNRIAIVVDLIFSDPVTYSGTYIWLAVLLFPLQLYTDFCGCMDIIMGASECFGIVLPENFQAPFFSRTIQEIWQRWHITLGLWLKNYIMNPILKTDLFVNMGSNLKKKIGKKWGKRIPTFLAMFILWCCMGLWHGSHLKYIFGEGVWYWFIIVMEQILEPPFKSFYEKHSINTNTKTFTAVRVIRTYILFAVGMIFFRADSFDMIKELLVSGISTLNFNVLFETGIFDLGLGLLHTVILIIGIIARWRVDAAIYAGQSPRALLRKENAFGRWVCYFGMIALIILSMSLSTQEFLYAQF